MFVVNTNLPVVSYNLVGGRGISSTGYWLAQGYVRRMSLILIYTVWIQILSEKVRVSPKIIAQSYFLGRYGWIHRDIHIYIYMCGNSFEMGTNPITCGMILPSINSPGNKGCSSCRLTYSKPSKGWGFSLSQRLQTPRIVLRVGFWGSNTWDKIWNIGSLAVRWTIPSRPIIPTIPWYS